MATISSPFSFSIMLHEKKHFLPLDYECYLSWWALYPCRHPSLRETTSTLDSLSLTELNLIKQCKLIFKGRKSIWGSGHGTHQARLCHTRHVNKGHQWDGGLWNSVTLCPAGWKPRSVISNGIPWSKEGGGAQQTGLIANPLPYQALPLTVWCEVTNASMWITEFLAFYSQVSATVATRASTRLVGPGGAVWYGKQKLLLVKLASSSIGLGLFGGCACEWVLYVYSVCSSDGEIVV